MSNMKIEALESFTIIIQNNMDNIFNEAWKAAETAGQASADEEFVKGFVKTVSKEMFKKGWTKSTIVDYVEKCPLIQDDDRDGFKMNFFARILDAESYSLSSGIADGAIKDVVKSKCFGEVVKMYRKLLGC